MIIELHVIEFSNYFVFWCVGSLKSNRTEPATIVFGVLELCVCVFWAGLVFSQSGDGGGCSGGSRWAECTAEPTVRVSRRCGGGGGGARDLDEQVKIRRRLRATGTQ